ncbi:hypothetical protein [Leuconostoc falkenbergense]|uniref:hypothetical protein n=1 Tax=Leuconostoc falkenbergense TaxID=2766470 RepID=UPI0019674DF2|nr:hypothetical protein [Leuconostoc falkenbergense]QSB51541.1 hypothetical protein I6J31_00390 [Leuconostoc falkenbergense]
MSNRETTFIVQTKQKSSLKDVNDDVQVQLEKAQSITDYLRRINDNQHDINKTLFKNDYLDSEIGKAENALVILNEFIDTAVNLLKSVE